MGKRPKGLKLPRRITLIVATAIVALMAGAGTVLADANGWFGSSDNVWPYNSTGDAPVLATVGDISCQLGTPQGKEKPTDTCDQRVVLIQPRRLASDLAERRVCRRAGRLQSGRRLVRERDELAGAGPEPGSRAMHAGILASAVVQLDGQPFNKDSMEGETAQTAWWPLLYAHHATLILNGHDHVYSRFGPMNPTGNPDPRHGVREFIVGTGGESLDTVNRSTPNLQAWADQYYGVMKLRLGRNGYSWDYQSALESPSAPAGTPASYSDSGFGRCNGGDSRDR